MITVSTETIEGKKIVKALGLASGNTVRARHAGRDIMAGLKNIVGGEISEYSKLMSDAREEAEQRMIKEAEKLGANAVVNVRFTTSQITAGASEILAYGTVVVVE